MPMTPIFHGDKMLFARAPTGTILGTVADSSRGLYSAPALPSGDYSVRAEVSGFRTLLRDAQVTAGGNTTVDLAMTVEETSDFVNVEAPCGANQLREPFRRRRY